MDQILSSIGLGSGVTGALYDGNTAATTPAASSAGSFWNSLSNFGSGLLQFGQQALPVATQVNNLVNSNQGNTAQNNTASATGVFSSANSSTIFLIGGAIVGVILLLGRRGK